jgi:hypothetical protein
MKFTALPAQKNKARAPIVFVSAGFVFILVT